MAEKETKNKKQEADALPEKNKKKLLAIILPVVAVILVAAILVSGYFFWYKPKSNIEVTGGGSATKQSVKLDNDTITYETAGYNGCTVPAFVAEMLTAADKDSEEACSKYGTAMTVAGHKVSEIEFGMLYYDMFIYAIDHEINDSNGLAPVSTKAPAQQKYGSADYTWSDRLTAVTCDKIKERYILFYDALENGFLISDYYEEELEQAKKTVETYAGYSLRTADEDLVNSYFEGVTLNLYMRNMIIKVYSEAYTEALKTKFGNEYNDAQLTAVYNKNPENYDYVDVRVFLIYHEDTENAEKAEKEVTDLKSFYAFGKEYMSIYPDYEEYQEKDTRYFYRTSRMLKKEFGESIAEWAFEKGRKHGDVAVLAGDVAWCLVYMEKPQYMLESFNCHECFVFYNDTLTTKPDEEEERYSRETIAEQYKKLEKSSDKTAAFEEIAAEYNENSASYYTRGSMEGVRVTDVESEFADWLNSKSRKAGDTEVLKLSVGYDMVMFDGKNTGDYDYYPLVRSDLADNDFNSYYDSLVAYDGNKCEMNRSCIAEGSVIGESACEKYAEIRRSNQESQQTAQTQN